MKSKLLLSIVVVTLMSSCKLGHKFSQPDLYLPQSIDTMQVEEASIADMQWWQIYTDTTLQALINKTLENNKDLKIAAARIAQMAAMKRIDNANMLPQLNGNIYAQKEALIMAATTTRTIPKRA